MPEPLTLLPGLVTFCGSIVTGVVGGEAHRLFRQWLETANDPATGLPRNHDLNRASRESLRGAVQVLLSELAGRLDPDRGWFTRRVEHGRWTAWLARPLFPDSRAPAQQWLDAFREAVAGPDFDAFHDRLELSDAQVRSCFREGEVCTALGPALAEKLLAWARATVRAGNEPTYFEPMVRKGWPVREGGAPCITLAHAYCLFFREHLKSDPRVFNTFTADALNALHSRLEAQGAQVAGELAELRAAVAKLAAHPPVFSQFEAWLTPQLGELKELLAGVRDQLDALARGQNELKAQQGEILVAITTLRAECLRDNPDAAPALAELTSHLTRLERRLDHLIGGLPITRFQLPDPPTRELQLLEAKHRTVTLLGRDQDLADLCAWVESAEPISCRLLVGGAGTGKTRLGFELLLRVAEALPGWQAGLLRGADLRRLVERTHAPDFNWPAPTLLVVDYAQTLSGPLGELLLALTHLRRAGLPPLRLLLLERQPGDWFDDLLRREDNAAPCAVRDLFHPPRPLPLTPLPPGQFRRQILRQTLDRAAALNHRPAPALPPEDNADFEAALARDLFDQPLNLMMAALAAGELELSTALKRERIDLAESLAERELRRVERFARDANNAAQKRALRHLAACATMEHGFTAEELDRAVREELAALQVTWPDGPGDLATRVREVLPGERIPVAPVEPDFIGEALVLTALARPDCRTGPERWKSWCATVVRCARRDPRATPATLLHAFQNFGGQDEYGEPLLEATDKLIESGLADQEPTLLMGIESALPHHTVKLRARAAEVTSHLYTRLKAAMAAGRDDLKPEVARLANNLGVRLSALGRWAEALAAAQEAVALRRALARANPNAFNPDLAMSLNNLANLLSELGRRAEALAPAQEAVALRRALARANPDAFNPGLARSLNTLANRLSELGRRAEALEPAQEAVALRRALARANPDAFNPDLARSLNNLAIRLSELDRRAEALKPAQEAVGLFRALARANPDAFNPDLASSLNTLANLLSELGRRAEALAPAQEAVALYRALARANPDAFNPDLARSLGALGLVLAANERAAEARARLAEGIRVLTPAFLALPEAHQPLMAWLVANYLLVCAALCEAPDAALLGPVLPLLNAGPEQGG